MKHAQLSSVSRVLLLGALPLAACNRTIVDDFGPLATVEMLPTPWLDPTAVMVEGPREVSVTSTIPFPCQPYALAAYAFWSGSQLTVRIEGRNQDGCPQDVTGTISYRAGVVNAPVGTIRLRVIHTHREWDLPPDTVFVGDVVIPSGRH